jgi:hypothetical protein
LVLSAFALVFVVGTGCSKPHTAASPGRFSIAGRWYVELSTGDAGCVRTVMTFDQNGATFEAYSREGAAGEVIGGFKLLAAELLTHYLSRGALLHFLNGSIARKNADSASVTATFASPLGDMKFLGTLLDSTFEGTLWNGGREAGRVWGFRRVRPMPLDDYPALVESVLTITEAKIYDAKQMQTPEWANFIATLRKGATRSQDDADMVFKFFQASRSLPFSHFYLFGAAPDSVREFHPAEANENAAITLSGADSGCAVLRIRSFAGDARPIDSCFRLIAAARVSALIIDLRGNPGGNVSAMRVAAHLADRPYSGGAFVTRKWFTTHGAPPTLEQMNAFPQLTEANVKLLLDGIHDQEGLSLQVTPDSLRYTGRVYVLVDGSTASACEPLVYALKQYKLAPIVGENTAGQMLNGEEFDCGSGWKLFVPTADYYTADGVRLDHWGVAPDRTVKSDDAMRVVKGWIARAAMPQGAR